MDDESEYDGSPEGNAIAALQAENERLRVLLRRALPFVEHLRAGAAATDVLIDDIGAALRAEQEATPQPEIASPKESDFPNDYLAFDRAMRAHQMKLAIEDENRRQHAPEQKAVPSNG